MSTTATPRYHLHLEQSIGETPRGALYCAAAGCAWNHQLTGGALLETARAVEEAVRLWIVHVEGRHPEALTPPSPSPARRVWRRG